MKPDLNHIIRTAIQAAAYQAGVTGGPENFDIEIMPYLIEKTEWILELQQLDDVLPEPKPWITDRTLADPNNITRECIFEALFCIDEEHWQEVYSVRT